eukprot:3217383-Ditylum_brightwellii.AAC.1
MGGYQSLLSKGNKLSSVHQAEAIAIHAFVALGCCSHILCQTRISTKGGACCVSLICARQEYHCQQITFLNKGQTQKEKIPA